jgi:Flp pilus assembly protein TadD
VLVLATLAGALGTVSGCSSSSATDTDWKAQKAYGATMAKKGFWREALFRFQKAAQQKPDDAEIQNNLAVGYEATGETARALAAYRRAIELSPNDANIRRNYARFAEYYTAAQRTGAPAEAPTPAPTPRPTP